MSRIFEGGEFDVCAHIVVTEEVRVVVELVNELLASVSAPAASARELAALVREPAASVNEVDA